jgi:hypothetical protein
MSQLDEQMTELADLFAGRLAADTDVLAADELDRGKLDFSLESLKVVDAWLAGLHEGGVDPNTEEAAETIIWTGAYVGEVIRRNPKQPYRWQRYEDYIADKPENIRRAIPHTFGTQLVLVNDSGMTLPINKVCRWLAEGPEHSLHFYAAAR